MKGGDKQEVGTRDGRSHDHQPFDPRARGRDVTQKKGREGPWMFKVFCLDAFLPKLGR